MPDEDVEVRPEDALQVAQRALAKANRIEELDDRLTNLEEELAAVNLRLSEFDEDREYEDLTRDDKVGLVREYAYRRAEDGNGRTLDYSDIREKVFDGEPSPAHCYDLMEWAARARGFEHRNPTHGNEVLYVDPDRAREGFAVYSAKKDSVRGAASR